MEHSMALDGGPADLNTRIGLERAADNEDHGDMASF
jgi:hypothetical protein